MNASEFRKTASYEIEDIKLYLNSFEQEIRENSDNIDLNYLEYVLSHINEGVQALARAVKDVAKAR